MLFAAVISVLMRTIVYLWGPESLRSKAAVAVIKHHEVAA
jgi:hypothetical protein